MIKIISKKEYEDLIWIIETQNKQIEELIDLVKEAQAGFKHSTKCYCDLVELIDEYVMDLPEDTIEEINNIKKLMNEDRP